MLLHASAPPFLAQKDALVAVAGEIQSKVLKLYGRPLPWMPAGAPAALPPAGTAVLSDAECHEFLGSQNVDFPMKDIVASVLAKGVIDKGSCYKVIGLLRSLAAAQKLVSAALFPPSLVGSGTAAPHSVTTDEALVPVAVRAAAASIVEESGSMSVPKALSFDQRPAPKAAYASAPHGKPVPYSAGGQLYLPVSLVDPTMRASAPPPCALPDLHAVKSSSDASKDDDLLAGNHRFRTADRCNARRRRRARPRRPARTRAPRRVEAPRRKCRAGCDRTPAVPWAAPRWLSPVPSPPQEPVRRGSGPLRSSGRLAVPRRSSYDRGH